MTTFLFLLTAIFIAAASAAYLSPRRFIVKASRPDVCPPGSAPAKQRSDFWLTAATVREENGDRISLKNRFVGLVGGDSMISNGLPRGSTFLADLLTLNEKRQLKFGDIVVVEARPGEEASCRNAQNPPSADSGADQLFQYCLRVVNNVEGDTIHYQPDGDGDHPPHDLDRVVAVVTRVIKSAPRSGVAALFSGRSEPAEA